MVLLFFREYIPLCQLACLGSIAAGQNVTPVEDITRLFLAIRAHREMFPRIWPWHKTSALSPPMCAESVTKRLLCIPVQSTYECKTRREERGLCPPRGEADAHNSPSMP